MKASYYYCHHQFLFFRAFTGHHLLTAPPSLIAALNPPTFQPSIRTAGVYFSRHCKEIMGETIGLLKVIVVEGKRLAIRDFTSSDPYVVVSVGDQTKKTKVINSCLNPVWNEELTFYVKLHDTDLKLEVFDRDRFKFDDKMGYAYLSLQPIVSASKLKRALKLSKGDSETNLRKVAPNRDNCLIVDSDVTYVNGEIVQDVYLKLLDVESGDLFVKLKWFDLPT